MKKILVTLSVSIALFTISVFAHSSPAKSKDIISTPLLPGGFSFDIKALFWNPSTPALDYATIFPNAASFNNGKIGTIKPDYDFGLQASISYAFACTSNDIRLTFTHYDKEFEKGVTAQRPFKLFHQAPRAPAPDVLVSLRS